MAALAHDISPSSSSFNFQSTSPLDTLVRRTSSKRFKQKQYASVEPSTPVNRRQRGPSHEDYVEQYDDSAAYDYNPRPPQSVQKQQLSPPSPLLHSHFARHSTATASSNGDNSYLDFSRSSVASASTDTYPYQYDDDASVYSEGPAMRESWQSAAGVASLNEHGSTRPDLRYEDSGTRTPSHTDSPNPDSLPIVVVSSPGIESAQLPRPVSRGGRAPITAQVTANFSRPVRPPTLPPPNMEEQKRLVLERNAGRGRSPSNPSPHSMQSSTFSQTMSQPHPPSGSPSYMSSQGRSPSQMSYHLGHGSFPAERSTSPQSLRSPSPNMSSHTQFSTGLRSMASAPNLDTMAGPSKPPPPQSVSQLRGPPDLRSGSPTSVYSGYSFYQLPPSPAESTHPPAPPPTITVTPSPSSQPRATTPSAPNLDDTQTPQHFLQLGIQHHEANRLKESAECFERAAKVQGGCGVGMLMYGLALRHGWGCEKNEKVAFKWLRKAAENAVEDLESARANRAIDVGAVQNELVLAIYEVGQCFFQGWGVPKDQKMAVSYYKVAARLGDPDAQQDLGFCLANGKGCKKDRKEAAKWYRAAVAQGASDIGLAWIYKDKYQ